MKEYGISRHQYVLNFCGLFWQDPDGVLLASHLLPEDQFPAVPDQGNAGDSEQAVKEATAHAVAASAGSTKG